MDNHHALLFFGESIKELPLKDEYKTPSQDVTHVIIDSFGIDDARSLTLLATQRPVSLDRRVFVIVVRAMTSEAQNALLKLLEEPPDSSLFYLMVPKEGVLIPTLLSRLLLVDKIEKKLVKNDVFTLFLTSNYAERLSLVTSITKEKDEKSIELILKGAEYYADKQANNDETFLRSLLFVRSYSGVRGSSSKMLLEELALSLPKG